MINVTKIVQTCGACPSQWSGRTDNGQYLYVRYRWGFLRVELDGDTIFEQTLGDGLDGVLDFDDLVQHVGHLIDFSKAEWVTERKDLHEPL
jgi:hypothetical protein